MRCPFRGVSVDRFPLYGEGIVAAAAVGHQLPLLLYSSIKKQEVIGDAEEEGENSTSGEK